MVLVFVGVEFDVKRVLDLVGTIGAITLVLHSHAVIHFGINGNALRHDVVLIACFLGIQKCIPIAFCKGDVDALDDV